MKQLKVSALFASFAALSLCLLAPSHAITALIKQGQSGTGAGKVSASVLLTDSATGQTGQTGLASTATETVELPGATTFVAASGMFVDVGNGDYDYFPAASETAGTGILKLHVTAPGCLPYDTSVQIVGSDPASSTVTVGSYASGQDPYTLLMAGAFLTIPGDHTTSGQPVTLTYKQMLAISLAVPASDNSSTVPAPGSTAATSYYLAGQPAVSGNLVYIGTVTYNAAGIPVGRTVKIASPFPAVN